MMEKMSGWKLRLKEALVKGEKIKIVFQYPGAYRITLKSGIVLETYHDSFCLDERDDGKTVYSYDYIVEIRGMI